MEPEQTIKLDTILVQVEDILTTPLDDELALLNLDTGKYYGMDSVSRRIWELIEQPQAVSALCEQLLTEFEVDEATCRQEVLHFLQELADADLVHVVEV